MRRHLTTLVLVGALLVVAACGDDGGGDDDARGTATTTEADATSSSTTTEATTESLTTSSTTEAEPPAETTASTSTTVPDDGAATTTTTPRPQPSCVSEQVGIAIVQGQSRHPDATVREVHCTSDWAVATLVEDGTPVGIVYFRHDGSRWSLGYAGESIDQGCDYAHGQAAPAEILADCP